MGLFLSKKGFWDSSKPPQKNPKHCWYRNPSREGAAGLTAGQTDTCGQRAPGRSWAQLVLKVTGISAPRFATIRCHNNNNNSVLLRKQAPGPPRLFPAHVSCNSLTRATAISKPSHGKRLEAAAKVNISSSPPHREGLGAALGPALDAQITASPAGMLRAPARQPGEVVKNHLLPARNGRPMAGSIFFPAVRMFSDGCSQPQGQLSPWHSRSFPGFGSYKATAIELWWGCFALFFYFSGNFIIIVKEIINSGCREAGGRLRALPWVSGDREGGGRCALIATRGPCPLGS